MPWPSTSSVQAIDLVDLLEIHVNGFNMPQIQGGMDRSYDQAAGFSQGQADSLVAKIESYVALVLGYDTQINASAPNAGLVKADVLEWSLGGQLEGLRDERKRYVKRILLLLGLDDMAVRGNSGRVIRT